MSTCQLSKRLEVLRHEVHEAAGSYGASRALGERSVGKKLATGVVLSQLLNTIRWLVTR